MYPHFLFRGYKYIMIFKNVFSITFSIGSNSCTFVFRILCGTTGLDPNLILSTRFRKSWYEYKSTFAYKNLKLKAIDINFIT